MAKKLVWIDRRGAELVAYSHIKGRRRKYYLKCNGIQSSEVLAMHTSCGAIWRHGYRRVHFVTASGIIFYGKWVKLETSSHELKDLSVWSNREEQVSLQTNTKRTLPD
jgi:hypothetical protein